MSKVFKKVRKKLDNGSLSLSKCPFCGSKVKIKESEGLEMGVLICTNKKSSCIKSGLFATVDLTSYKTAKRGILQWNTRV